MEIWEMRKHEIYCLILICFVQGSMKQDLQITLRVEGWRERDKTLPDF